MKDSKSFKGSDGWLFVAIFNTRKLRLASIISIGDMLNHAIFMLDEINDGLSRFESEGYFEIKGLKITATKKAKLFEKRNKKHFEDFISKQIRYQEIFSKTMLENEVAYKNYFSQDKYDTAIKKYCKL